MKHIPDIFLTAFGVENIYASLILQIIRCSTTDFTFVATFFLYFLYFLHTVSIYVDIYILLLYAYQNLIKQDLSSMHMLWMKGFMHLFASKAMVQLQSVFPFHLSLYTLYSKEWAMHLIFEIFSDRQIISHVYMKPIIL